MSDARVSQLPTEVVVKGDSDARVSQLPTEVVVKGDSDARLSQLAVEVVWQALPPTAGERFWATVIA
jgi:hypothetical protein